MYKFQFWGTAEPVRVAGKIIADRKEVSGTVRASSMRVAMRKAAEQVPGINYVGRVFRVSVQRLN